PGDRRRGLAAGPACESPWPSGHASSASVETSRVACPQLLPCSSITVLRGHDETSPPAISASGRGRCRPARVFTDRRSARLSVAASARDCALRARWRDRYIRPADRTKANRAAWEPVLRRECYRRE